MREGFAIVYKSSGLAVPDQYLTGDILGAASPHKMYAKLFPSIQAALDCRATLNAAWQCSAQVVYLTEYDTQRPN